MLVDRLALDLAVALNMLATVYIVIMLRGEYSSEVPMGLLLARSGVESIVRLSSVVAVDRGLRVHNCTVWSLVAD